MWFKYPASPYGRSGVSDVLGCYRGRFIAIELKAPGAYKDPRIGLTPQQKRFLDEVEANDGIAFCADTFEEIERVLNAVA